VVFNSSADWKRYGSALFGGVSTDNGGIYLGDPARPGNQARFFAYEAEWKRPAFQVWNLRHEYVHSPGRPLQPVRQLRPLPQPHHLVVGRAGGASPVRPALARGLDNVAGRPASDRPALADILHLDYDKGGEMVYSWSYSAPLPE
jgi:hypothetical protein